MNARLLPLLCIAVLCITLTLGLSPFHAPRNEVTWLPSKNGLHFGKYATTFSLHPLLSPEAGEATEASVEIWLQPRRIWDSGTFLALYRSSDLSQFSFRQSLTDLVLHSETPKDQAPSRAASVYIDDVFHEPRRAFITVTFGPRGVCSYVDGRLTSLRPCFPLAAAQLSGRLILGDSARQPDSWQGNIFGLAIYSKQLRADQVLRNYTAWKTSGRPEISPDERNIDLYTFDERAGRAVHDHSQYGVDLYIPETYQVLDKIALQPFWTEFEMTRNYWGAVLKNVVGFIPFGFCYYAFLGTLLRPRKASLLTIGLGGAVSVMIEVLQAFLPTRDSGTSDIITNTLGTWIGVAFYRLLTPALARWIPRLPMPLHRNESASAVRCP